MVSVSLRRLVCILLFSATFASAATKGEVVSRLLALRSATDYTASARLVRVEASGERRNTSIAIRAHAFPDGLRIFCDVTARPSARARLLLFVPSQGNASIRIGHPGDPSPQTLPRDQWGESLLGTNFTYEDNSVLT